MVCIVVPLRLSVPMPQRPARGADPHRLHVLYAAPARPHCVDISCRKNNPSPISHLRFHLHGMEADHEVPLRRSSERRCAHAREPGGADHLVGGGLGVGRDRSGDAVRLWHAAPCPPTHLRPPAAPFGRENGAAPMCAPICYIHASLAPSCSFGGGFTCEHLMQP